MKCVRFQVLMTASMKMAVFWAVASCSLVEVYKRYSDAFCLHFHTMKYTNNNNLF
jgi:hypothetical protein